MEILKKQRDAVGITCFDKDINIHTTAKSEDECLSLLSGFGVPFETKTDEIVIKEDKEIDPYAKYRKKKSRKGKVLVGKK